MAVVPATRLPSWWLGPAWDRCWRGPSLRPSILVTRLPAGEPWILPAVLLVFAGAAILDGVAELLEPSLNWQPVRRALGISPGEALQGE